MKVTPLEIRQQTFEKVFRGYDKDAVDAYLTSLSQEWERGQEELRALRQRNESLQEEIGRLKAIENTLYRTLQMAEETTSQMTHKAKTEADERLQSAHAEADETLNNARKQANMLVLEAENRTRFILDESVEELRGLERDYKAIERYKEHLVAEIKRYANDALDKAARFEEKVKRQTFEAKFGELKAINLPTEAPETEPEAEAAPVPAAEVPAPVEAEAESVQAQVADVPAGDQAEAKPEEPREPHRPGDSVPLEVTAQARGNAGSFFDTIH